MELDQEFEDDHGVHQLDFRVEPVVPHPDEDHLLAVVRHQDVDRLLRQGVVQEVLDDPQDVLQEDLEVLDVGHLKGHLQGDHLQEEDVGESIPVLQVRLLHRVNFSCVILF